MKGAIIGDIVGSAYERHNTRVKDFKLFKNRCEFTDDTVFTAAVADALLTCRDLGQTQDMQICAMLVKKMQAYGRAHPEQHGSKFFRAWVISDDPKPYNGYTNGALMRCSAAGWLAGTVEEAQRLGRLTALPTHNHPEALTAASMAAELIFRARTGASKEALKAIAQREYAIPSVAFLQEHRSYDISCKATFPLAFAAFYESCDFEDTIRTAVSLGGDTDTNAAIAGSFAEAFYGVPEELWAAARAYCTEDILAVADRLHAL